jgi:ribA/ribD-fused uncharacterized protein
MAHWLETATNLLHSGEQQATIERAKYVIAFYSHRSGDFAGFSNFFESPFEYLVPDFCREIPWVPTSVHCEFSEKAIMLSKAALMRDVSTMHAIIRGKTPSEVKKLGRNVRPWNQVLWNRHVEEIAFQAVYQKFKSNDGLKQLLLSTGDSILAETKDKIWGIGLDGDDPRVADPRQWKGLNIQGMALMRAREKLQSEEDTTLS